MVVRREGSTIRRYCHIGTGNYHPKTARLYEDVSLLTALPEIGADLTDLFNSLTGYSRKTQYRNLLVAPYSIRPVIIERIDAEVARALRGEDHYLRRLRDWKMSADIDTMRPRSTQLYAQLCGWTLARAHARSGDRVAISAYLSNSTTFDNALADFAETYADQNEHDRSALAAGAAGTVQAQSNL
ncbi:hypothetical protein AXA44_47635 [Rhodococcus sp. SC4]|nr:Polyphosphate kinase [Rhodococcus opacus PD630]KXF52286.1 hypothetical protein AXA44_47635 [Rhodococcus sp. SC4]